MLFEFLDTNSFLLFIGSIVQTVCYIKQKPSLPTMSPTSAVQMGDETLDTSTTTARKKPLNKMLLMIYILCSAVGSIGGPFIQRLYYTKGGTLNWLQSWIVSVGFVVSIPVIALLFFRDPSSDRSIIDLRLFISSAIVGLLYGLNNYMYSTGLAYIPVSTSALLFATQLAFIAIFAFLIVKQKFTFYSLNSVLVMTLGAVVLALHTDGDRPPGVSKGKYFLGFFLTLGGAALWGVTSPLIQLAYSKSSTSRVTFMIVLQSQVVMNAFAALFSLVGMLATSEFQKISDEAKQFTIGEEKYYVILVTSALAYQLSTLGGMGIISITSSLFSGIVSSVLLPLGQVGAVLIFKEKFTGEKGLSLALCLWGFTSYFLGEYKKTRKPKPIIDHENEVEPPRETDLGLSSQAANGV